MGQSSTNQAMFLNCPCQIAALVSLAFVFLHDSHRALPTAIMLHWSIPITPATSTARSETFGKTCHDSNESGNPVMVSNRCGLIPNSPYRLIALHIPRSISQCRQHPSYSLATFLVVCSTLALNYII